MKVNLPMLVLIDNIGAVEMLDMKSGKCRTKHVNTRFHWIKEFIDNEIVLVKYIKSEENVSDICTKNLPANLFKKHSSKLITNVGFIVRCNTRLIGKAETWEDTCWTKEERLRRLAEPMGEIWKYHHDGFGITKWYPNYGRLRRLKRRVQGPLQKNYWNIKCDWTRSLVYPSERHVIKK